MATVNRNPDHNAYLQACLDLKDMGAFVGSATLDQMIAELSAKTPAGRKLRRDTQAKWDSHQYADKSIVYAQVAVAPQLMGCLSPEALSVLLFLGTHCLQSGLIRASYDTISRANGISRTKAREAVAELKDCGALGIYDKNRRHSAPIYSVDPALVNIGKRDISRQHKEHMKYVTATDNHLLKRSPDWDVVAKAVTMPVTSVETDDKGEAHEVERRIRFADVSVEPHTKKAPESGNSEGNNRTNGGAKPSTQTNRNTDGEDTQIPGQMEVSDFPDLMPETLADDGLPEDFFRFGDFE